MRRRPLCRPIEGVTCVFSRRRPLRRPPGKCIYICGADLCADPQHIIITLSICLFGIGGSDANNNSINRSISSRSAVVVVVEVEVIELLFVFVLILVLVIA